ncbi:MAG TPA: hypothetical protein VH141_03735 [Pseudonocardia sp.]|jgi:hypothetical protein|nr:hypothetical protein [Pseudonocardia sp.]
MSSMPTRLVLAGSVLALGSVGTVSAVHLESAPTPFGTTPGTPLALTPGTAAPPAPSLAPPATAPAPAPPASGKSSRSVKSTDPLSPVSAKDLVNLAKEPKRAVTVAVDDLQRSVSNYGAATDATDDYNSGTDGDDPVRRIVVRGPRYDDSDGADSARRDFARQVARRWSERGDSGRADSGRADSGRGTCDTDSGDSRWGRRISNPFLTSHEWRAGPSRDRSASHYDSARHHGGGDSMGSRDYVGRHRAE